MNDPQTFEGMPDPDSSIHSQYSKLAVWLQQVLELPPQREAIVSEVPENENQLAVALGPDYHLPYYQQLPDFAMAMLTEDVQAAVRYSSLLYHLARSANATVLTWISMMRCALPLIHRGFALF